MRYETESKSIIGNLRRAFTGFVLVCGSCLLLPSAQAQDAVTLSFLHNFVGVDTMMVVKDYTEFTVPEPGQCGPWIGVVEVIVTGGSYAGQTPAVDYVLVRFENPLRTLKRGDRLIVTSSAPIDCNGRYIFDTVVAK